MKALELTEKLLKSRGMIYTKYRRYIMMSCMSGRHKDEHPSMIINSRGGVYCKSCGFVSTVSKLFDIDVSKLDMGNPENLEIVVEPDPKFSITEEHSIEDITAASFDYPLPSNFNLKRPVHKIRGISIKTLEDYDVYVSDNWTVFPIWKDLGYSKIKLGYAIRTEDGWVFSKKIDNTMHFSSFVYPLINAKQSSFLFLVEGMFDALALIDKGFPALAMFGGWTTKSHTSTDMKLAIKESFFFQYAPKNLILYFDDDPAGYEYTKNATRYFSKRYNVTSFVASEDPDDFLLKENNIETLKKFIKDSN